MLRRLTIRDFVIVDTLELDFASGFGALTGETGAGKSILVDALSLALGERADAGVVRAGRERAEISAEFGFPPQGAVARWLRDNDCPGEGDGCLLRRVVDSGGRSRCYINGSPVTLTQMRELAQFLADIHGQHAHHSLLRAEVQRALLDGLGGAALLADEVVQRYRAWHSAREARLAAEKNAEANAREREMLAFQVDELAALAFDPADWGHTNQEHGRLAHVATLLEGAAQATEALADGDHAAGPQLDRIAARLSQLCEFDPGLKAAAELAQAASIQVEEACHALRRYRDRLDADPQRLRETEARIDAVQSMARKYRISPDGLTELLQHSRARLHELESLQDAGGLAEREAALRKGYLARAAELTKARRKAALRLSREVTQRMQELAMPGGRFEAALRERAEGGPHGMEDVEYLVSAHEGQPLAPLAKVASGGELSRIGLAIQVIAASATEVPTLLFDEVDVGIGGGVAEVVGRLLKQLGASRQVLCVTHLPQVAAQADWQWSVAKEGRDGQVVSRVRRLDHKGRIEEIARMLGGLRITDTTRKHAAEMLGS